MEKELYLHISIKSDEVAFRVDEDFVQGINRLALITISKKGNLIAYCILSNHLHIIITSGDPQGFIKSFKCSYTKWFNNKYSRTGELFTPGDKIVKLESIEHILIAIDYVLRNPIHHNITEYPTNYPYSSAKFYFSKQMGFEIQIDNKIDVKRLISKRNIPYTKSLTFSASGIIYPYNFLSIKRCESLYQSVRNFAFHLNRPLKEENISFLGNETDEKCSLLYQLQNKVLRITDIEACNYIENYLKNNLNGKSFTQLTTIERNTLSEILLKIGCIDAQIRRCLPFQGLGEG